MTGPGTTLASVLLVASGWAVVLAGASGSDGKGAAKPKSGRPAAKSAREASKPSPAADKARKGLVPIPLKLPEPEIIGTPPVIPPGTRVRITKGGWKPRKPFYVPKGVANLALKKPVTGSDMEPTIGTLDLITDDNKEAGDGNYVELGPEVQWVQIDLLKAARLHAIIVWHEHHQHVVYHDVIVQVADEKDFITNVRTLYNNDHDNSAGMGIGKDWGYYETYDGLLVDAKGIKARYVRLYSNGSTAGDMNRYTEVAVYGLEAK
jgi:hypothetical protein